MCGCVKNRYRTAIKNFFFGIPVKVDNKEKGEIQGMQLLRLQPCFCHVSHIWHNLCTLDFDVFALPPTLNMFLLTLLSLGGKTLNQSKTSQVRLHHYNNQSLPKYPPPPFIHLSFLSNKLPELDLVFYIEDGHIHPWVIACLHCWFWLVRVGIKRICNERKVRYPVKKVMPLAKCYLIKCRFGKIIDPWALKSVYWSVLGKTLNPGVLPSHWESTNQCIPYCYSQGQDKLGGLFLEGDFGFKKPHRQSIKPAVEIPSLTSGNRWRGRKKQRTNFLFC